MLKKCYGLFLGLVVLTGSACVTPTHASSATILISSIRAGSYGSPTDERVAIYNNSSFEVDVTNWCLSNKAGVKFACLTPQSEHERIFLPAYSYATFLSVFAVEDNDAFDYSVMFQPTNNSSGSITASADTISILDANGSVVDQTVWSSALGLGQSWVRTKLSSVPDIYVDTNASIDWQKLIMVTNFPSSQINYRDVVPEAPIEIPDDPDKPVDTTLLPIVITEILPNAVGSDTNNEWIEIYNPNEFAAISMAGYQLAVGANLEKKVILRDYSLKPGEYLVLTNAEYAYTLLNTASKVALYSSEGLLVSEVISYTNPMEGKSWALMDGEWQYSSLPSPGSVNTIPSSEESFQEENSVTPSTTKPCAANQYRSPETNRCRLISSNTSPLPAPCKEGQERNAETNRCRAITASVTAACKQGQEKNPETNRCRNIKKMVEADHKVKGATTERQPGMGWYMWAAIIGIVVLVLGYAVWEWREELKVFIDRIKKRFPGKAN